VIGLILITAVVILVSGVFKGTPPEEIAQASPSPTQIISPTSAATTIPTGVMDANEVADPIFAAINDTPPDFADDFSQVDPGWLYYGEDPSEEMGCDQTDDVIMGITDGRMNLSLANCRVGILIHPDMHYSNYALQMDLNFQQTALGVEFRNWNESLSGDSIMLSFFISSRDGAWNFQALEHNYVIYELGGEIGLQSSIPVTVTIINKSPTFLVYADSSLLLTYQNPPENYRGPFVVDFTVNTEETTLNEPQMLELDNVKVWDLDRIEFADSSQTSDWVEEADAVAGAILAAIQDATPDFEEGFLEVDDAWLYVSDHCPDLDTTKIISIESGMEFTISPDCPLIGFAHPYFQYQSGDYVMQMHINFLQTDIGFEFGSEAFGVNFILWDESWAIFEPKFTNTNSVEMQVVDTGPVRSNPGNPVTLTIIKRSSTFLFYLDSALLGYYDIKVEDADQHDIQFNVNNWDDNPFDPETLLLHYFLFWDLDKIDITDSTQTSDWMEEANELAEPILVAIQGNPPDFADDFSQVDPDWSYGPDFACINADDIKMNISDGSMECSMGPDCRVGALSHPGLLYSNYVLQLDVDFQQTNLSLEFRNWNLSPSHVSELFDFWLWGREGAWSFQIMKAENEVENTGWKNQLDLSNRVTVTIK
jgi:hypothetical protein